MQGRGETTCLSIQKEGIKKHFLGVIFIRNYTVIYKCCSRGTWSLFAQCIDSSTCTLINIIIWLVFVADIMRALIG